MHLKQTIIAGLTATLAYGAMAEQLTLKSGYPESYVVQKGDTLWDISGQYLAEPWLWPRLWNINPQIANPHWIYPGDVLQLSWVNGEPRLGKASQGGKQVIHLSPKSRYENQANPVPTLPLSEIGPFLQTDHILADNQQARDLPYVLGNSEKHIGMLEGDTLYVQGALTPGHDYGVYHPGVTYKDRKTGVVTISGENLDKANVDKVFLVDDKNDLPCEVTEQSATSLKVKIPAKATGRMAFMIRTTGKEPKDIVQPVKVTVE